MKQALSVRKFIGAGVIALALCSCTGKTSAVAQDYAPDTEPYYADIAGFSKWVETFKRDAAAEGISQSTLNKAFVDIQPNDRVIELDRKQPEGTMTFEQYLEKVISSTRINEGKRMMRENKALLDKVSAKYGVQPRFIVALWGLETSYGKITGGFNLIEALATLAFDGRRSDFFRKELINALKIVDGGHIQLSEFKGSWAGAMGQCQFMPSSFHSFAQDGNGDGRKDIWGTREDVFASIANYLARSGWNNQETWGREIRVPQGFDRSLIARKEEKTLAEWARLGVTNTDGSALPQANLTASVVNPGEESGRYYLAYSNYRVIMKWNRSLYFATSVGILADHLEQ